MSFNNISRREFLGQASCAAVGSTAFLNTVLNLMMTGAAAGFNAYPGEDYKAIICFFLPGGADTWSWLVPRGTEYATYAATRGDLSLAQASLLPITPTNSTIDLGIHPQMPELQALFEQGKAAFVSNVGSLVKPTTKTDYDNGISLPFGLFSHSDQQEQWQTSIPDTRSAQGWGGRIADILAPNNSSSSVSMNISVAGNNLFQVGNQVLPYAVNPWGAVQLDGYHEWGPLGDIRTAAVDSLLGAQYAGVLERTYNKMKKGSMDAYQTFVDATSVGLPPGVTFPQDSLGQTLELIAKVIAGRSLLGVKRQVFFLSWAGWDMHSDTLTQLQQLMPILSRGLNAFYNATVAMNVSEQVTLFTASDFGRTLTSNGQGCDHAWGANHLVVGGAVKGRKVYGQYPDLAVDNPLDVGRGALIPTVSVDQYSAELALWMGVSKADLPYVLPNIGRFYNVNGAAPPLGFLV